MTLRILMVDDEPDAEIMFQQNFRREIKKGRYEFMFAQSGKEAVAILESDDAPSLLLLLSDINMPGMSGIDLLKLAKAQWPELPVIMITAYTDPETKKNVGANGADGLIGKPVDFALLKSRLLEIEESVTNV